MTYNMEQQKQYIANQIKAARVARGYTQLDLAEKTNISLRSIQRIESAQVSPRAYTLNILSATLGLQLQHRDLAPPAAPNTTSIPQNSIKKATRILIAAVAGLCLILFGGAFLAQSPAFPETTFELLLFWATLATLYLLLAVRYLR